MSKTVKEAIEEIYKDHEEATQNKDTQKLKECLERYRVLANSAPDEPNIIQLIATCEMQLGYNGLAVSLFKRVIAHHPAYVEAWNNLGISYKNENMNDKAHICFDRALRFRESSDIYNNICTLHVNEGTPLDGIPYARKAIELGPENPQPHWNLSLMLLESGQWEEGLSEYEWGLLSKDRPNRAFSHNIEDIPYWKGEKGKVVVVYGEQGMGDEIMWSSCIPDMVEDCSEVIFECHPRLQKTFERSFQGVKHFYPTRKEGTIDWAGRHKIDYRVGIGSLFNIYRKDGKFPKKAYLKADKVRVKHYREMLSSYGEGPYIGIGWAGGSKRTRADMRSFKLKDLLPILKTKGVTFVSLQYTEGAKEKLDKFYEETGIKIHHCPAVHYKDYDETVSLISALDLSILPNTTAVHLSGALGKKCWTLTPDACAWRYQLDGPQMPFYGQWVKQYRQKGDWSKVINKVAKDLEAFKNGR